MRCDHCGQTILTLGALRLDLRRREIVFGKVRVKVTPREADMIGLLLEEHPKPVTTEQFREAFFGDGLEGGIHTVLGNIRKKLKPLGAGITAGNVLADRRGFLLSVEGCQP